MQLFRALKGSIKSKGQERRHADKCGHNDSAIITGLAATEFLSLQCDLGSVKEKYILRFSLQSAAFIPRIFAHLQNCSDSIKLKTENH